MNYKQDDEWMNASLGSLHNHSWIESQCKCCCDWRKRFVISILVAFLFGGVIGWVAL